MSTKQELAKFFATHLAHAHRLEESRTSPKKVAAQGKILGDVVDNVARDIDALTYAESDNPWTEDDKYDLCGLIASELDVPKQNWQIIKEGSIAKAISFEQTLALLMKQVKFE